MRLVPATAISPTWAIHTILDADGTPAAGSVEDRVKLLVAENDRLARLLEREARRTDYDRLLLALDEDRDEVLMMLADACLDEGRAKEAGGWGWLAAHHKWPLRNRHGWTWVPVNPDAPDDTQRMCCAIPAALADAIGGRWEIAAIGRFGSPGLALRAVVDVIAEGRWRP